ncbi:hypothetical protein EUGRSUZ_G02028 [Eucalyptus grandis]|uniref:Uncharacterized protein n=2 Tax=Eucalyptus grandis TaxID=71139 RepID=A0ACC3K4G3_EUCGR|nr:hypothetical protein EUGRSUZ_G02028 [Eucalyptus grandis]
MGLGGSPNRVVGVEIAEGGLSRRRRHGTNDLTDIVSSWSLHDILNENLYHDQVETIPDQFQSVQDYLGSYVYPLLEETRASLCSSLENISLLPFTEIIECVESAGSGNSYAVKASRWNESNTRGKETYKTLPGDILILTDAKPATVPDLERFGRRWAFALVRMIGEDDEEDEATSSTNFEVETLLNLEVNNSWKPMYAIFLINIVTNKRIWKVLHMYRNLDILKEVLCTDLVADKVSNLCVTEGNGSESESLDKRLSHDLNESQKKAVGACLSKLHCENKPSVDLIWGPPGTGKTKTVATLLLTLLKRKHRTIVCAPTNVAIKEVATRVLKLLKESDSGISTEMESLPCYFGDTLIFGNKERLKVDSDIEDIYLEHRVERISEFTGWHQCLTSLIDTLADCVCQYRVFLENEHAKRRKLGSDDDRSEGRSSEEDGNCELKSFLEFFRDQFKETVRPLRACLYTFCTHISRTKFQNITSLFNLLNSFESLLCGEKLDSEMMEITLSRDELGLFSFETSMGPLYDIYMKRQECLSMLLTVRETLKDLKLPNFVSEDMIANFCYRHASLIFCTASSSYKLYSVEMEPLNLLVIDEAAQLKECESVIPLQLPGVKHLILVGDECQLPAMVESKVSNQAGFGRSLFERLSSLGYSRQLLNIQYRMHPSISLFPTSKFYQKQILDGPNVKSKSYRKSRLPWPMFGPYSFINIPDGEEQIGDDGCSLRNPVEVEVISRIVRNLYRAWNGSEEDLTVGVISPYRAQVAAVLAKLGKKFENIKGFMVKVKSVDGFQGGEEDIVIISTVRSNSRGNIGFLSSTKRTNVALTRARYCLWILGNGKTLTKSDSVWKAVVDNAKSRGCFFNVDDDKDLAKAILDVKKENNQLDDLLDRSSVLFRNARWKVLFSDNFLKSFRKLASLRTKMSIINLLSKLSSGWRPKKRNVDIICEHSSHIVRQFKADGFYVICTTDIVKELRYIQILKIWDVLPLEDVVKLVKRLDSIFETYSDDFISRCNEKCIEGDLQVPKTWACTFDFVCYRSASEGQFGSSSDADASDRRLYVENVKVSESLLLMKFYTLSSDIVRNLLDDSDGNEASLPFEVTEQEQEIILFPRSTFILGRSGTGKTTVLTMKLFRNEKLHDEATKGFQEIQSEGAEDCVLRQLFVTVSAKLCFAVKQHVSQLRSSSSGAKHKVKSSSVDEIVDDAALFKDIPDSFLDISPNSYPLVITFRKLLMMLDGTVGVSFFERFPDLRDLCRGQSFNSRPVALQSLLRAKEVTYEKFCAVYWPHFNDKIRRRLDPSRVFTEIMSHVKGGLPPADGCEGKLDRPAYVSISEGRVSTLSFQRREEIYDAFEDYEKMKMKNGEFDLADLVNDLHCRLLHGQFAGNVVDFVYIDEVQDLTMRQISLFKYICRNVDGGFVFSGDTAQTIARGIDFRFEDIRSLFYKDGNFVGFGAEQVILVRDDHSRSEISNLVRGQALVLTIVECKGLEFQDVLLYNFFGTSPLKSQWRVIYGYMKEHALLDNSSQWSSPSFDDAKHNILCSELKQLYVAITRTRQRLWICENALEFSKPILDYWKKKCLIQVRLVDHALAEAMQVRSTPEEWKLQGFKLLREGNYPMAIMCFERARYTYGEKLAKASAFKADADLKHISNPQEASDLRRQAAEIYETIGMADSAAECFYMLKEYEMAGKIYMDKCGESALEKAGECFSLARCYSLAAEAYARANIFSKCLSICAEGKLFEIGLRYIEDWKRQGTEKKSKEIEKLEQDFLESCTLHFYNLKDYRAMMKYVKAFHCIDSMRNLLKRLGCLDELISLEEEFGNFLEAAKIVRMKGDILREVDLLGKSGKNREASMNILWYILFYSLWAPGSKGWPLKQFAQEEELVSKAKLLAEPEPIAFYEYVSVESSILLNKQNSLAQMKEHLSASSRNGSVRGEILCARNILDFHLRQNISNFCWDYDWLVDPVNYSEQLTLENQISVDSLVCFWNLWREKIVRIIESVGCVEMPVGKENTSCWEFCLNYFGVLEQQNNMQITYHLLNPDSDWVRNIDKRSLHKKGQLVALDLRQLVSAAQKYWYCELTSVGMVLLHKLDALYQFLAKSSRSNFWQSRCLAILHEVAKFLQELCPNHSFQYGKALDRFIETSSARYFGRIFPLDWRISSSENMVSLRGSEASRNLLRETMNMIISKKHFSHGKMGELATLVLGSGMLDDDLYGKIAKSFKGNTPWEEFMECICRDVPSDLPQATCSKGQFYTTKSSLVEWLICHEGLAKPSFSFNLGNCLEPIIQFVTRTVADLLHNKDDTRQWIKNSNLNVREYYPLLVLKLVLLVCLLHLNFGISPHFLFDLLGKSWISEQTPTEFHHILSRCRRPNLQEISVGVLAEAFEKVDDPLVITNSASDCSKCPHAIILDVKSHKCKEEIMKVLFPKDGSAESSCKLQDLTEFSKDSSSSSDSVVVHVLVIHVELFSKMVLRMKKNRSLDRKFIIHVLKF